MPATGGEPTLVAAGFTQPREVLADEGARVRVGRDVGGRR